jgi:hypothetical protein
MEQKEKLQFSWPQCIIEEYPDNTEYKSKLAVLAIEPTAKCHIVIPKNGSKNRFHISSERKVLGFTYRDNPESAWFSSLCLLQQEIMEFLIN